MIRLIFAFAAVSGLISVVLGAFASHALKGTLEERFQHAFETAVTYQMSHSLALLIVCLLIEQWGRQFALEYAAYAFTVGILLFCGSLYLLALTGLKWFGPITPLGGLAFIIGWAFLAFGIFKHSTL